MPGSQLRPADRRTRRAFWTDATTHVDGLLRALSQRECWDLLSSHHVGRISYVDGDGPIVLPLNYVAFEGGIWIRTASYDQLGCT